MITSPSPTLSALPAPPARVHFVGIGGIGMSGLARLLHAWGYAVSGSDADASDMTAALAAEGIPVTIGHTDTARAAAADLLVVTAAIQTENPEVQAAAAAGVPVLKRAALLGLLANSRRCVAVAGSHGKSTTSGMLVTALRALGADPSYAVGAVVATTGTNAEAGRGDVMVVEADEYDYSFLWLQPTVAVVTSIDYDHPDLFPDQVSYDAAFSRFIAGIKPGGTLVLAADDPGCVRLMARPDFAPPPHLVTFGETGDVMWRLRDTDAGRAVETPRGELITLALAVPGRHNARNATAALATLAALGREPTAAAQALSTFAGVGRRFELKGEARGIIVVDDYAHHPTEIRATLRAARERFPNRRLWAVFQPHTFSRTRALLADFATAFTDADEVMILDVYPSREKDSLGISSHDLRRLMPAGVHAAGRPAEAADRLATLVRAGDVVITLGAGDVTATGPALIARLREQGLP